MSNTYLAKSVKFIFYYDVILVVGGDNTGKLGKN